MSAHSKVMSEPAEFPFVTESAVDTNAIGYLIGRGSQKWKVSFTRCGLGEKEIKTLKHQLTLPGKAGKIQALITICENQLDITSVVQLQEMHQALKNLISTVPQVH